MKRALVLAFLTLLGCGGESTAGSPPATAGTPPPATTSTGPAATDPALGEWGRAPTTPDPSGRMEGTFFTAAGAPAPMACTADADCVANTLPAPGGCCNDPTSLGTFSAAYSTWLAQWRGGHCAGVECPPPPAPAAPSDCYFRVHCAAGGCANSCRF